ncbi:MAG: dTDP-4-dehydrorhamnose reductase [Gammaproteobacteria bacterium]|nr:dTDP-4-dehydrorhamnose reductase [Gammaproteobacteria bacterium]
MKILLTGAKGQVGNEIQRRSTNLGLTVIPTSRATLDISDKTQIAAIFEHEDFDLIINAAAYTAVDNAESDKEAAFQVNAVGVEHLARLAKQHAIPLFHVSTDYVFDGETTVAYRETAKTNPQTVYGASKLEGENRLKEMLEAHIILRTSWVFGIDGNNFVKTMLRLGEANDELRVVVDQLGNPTFAGSIANALLSLAVQYRENGHLNWGTYHFNDDSTTTWHGFAKQIISCGHKHRLIKTVPIVHPISTIDYPTPALRPSYSSLDTSLFFTTFPEIGINDWQDGLEHMIFTLSQANS